MPRLLRTLLLFLAIMAVFALFGSGCSDDKPPTGGTPGPDDSTANNSIADSIVRVANDSLADMINEMINVTLENADSSFRPNDIDFESVYDLYLSALAANANNANAKFGAAFCGMMLFLQDPDLNTLVDEIKDAVDTGTFYPTKMLPQIGIGGDLTPNAVPMSPSKFNHILPDFTKFDNMVMAAAVTDPKFSDLQSVLENGLLPRINQAISYMDDLILQPSFVFYITPLMQGNPGADSIEIDKTDLHLFRAVLLALRGSLNIFFSRDLDFDSYDVAGLEDAIQQNSSFLDLRTGNYMADAKTDLIAAVNSVKNVLSGLIAEANSGESQDDDLIRAYADEVDDYGMAIDSITYYLTYFNGPKDLVISWSEQDCYWNGMTFICTTYTDSFVENIDVSRFFDNPIDNPKNLLPAYTFSMTPLSDLAANLADMHFEESAYWDNMYTIFQVSPGNESALADSVSKYNWFGYYSLPTVGTSTFYSQIANFPYLEQFVLGWDDVTTYSPGSKYLYTYGSDRLWEYRGYYFSDYWIGTCYGWTATDYTSWNFPNPTINGLLPDMTSDRIKEMIFDDPLNWEQGTCDTVSLEEIADDFYWEIF